MYDHIEKVKGIIEAHGIKYTTLKAEQSFEYLMMEQPFNTEKHGEHYGYGWPTPIIRWCTKHMKTKLSELYFKELSEQYNVILCTGIAADERERLERDWNQSHHHPLAEWNMTEADCLEYCRSKGYDWGGLYDIFRRVSCWCCPLARLSELRKLYENYPELWARLEEWEDKMATIPGNEGRQKFKGEYSVHDLSKRFSRELKARDEQTTLELFA